MKTYSILTAAALFLPVLAQAADSAKLISKSGDWESFTYPEKGGKVCYMASQPKKSIGAAKGRNNVFFTITHRTADKSIGVVSINAGFTYKPNAPAELDIGGAKFDLYTTADSAWARNDKALVAALLKAQGTAIAYADINKACDVK
jgi:hypothetical protein